jgi:antitoxin ParD1/3/4
MNLWQDEGRSQNDKLEGTMMGTEACMKTAQNRVIVDLGTFGGAVEERVNSGSYASTDEVVQAGLSALAREEASLNEWLTRQAEDSLADPRPSVPAAQVFRELRAKYGRPVVDPAS